MYTNRANVGVQTLYNCWIILFEGGTGFKSTHPLSYAFVICSMIIKAINNQQNSFLFGVFDSDPKLNLNWRET
jgi:hypothetical protein